MSKGVVNKCLKAWESQAGTYSTASDETERHGLLGGSQPLQSCFGKDRKACGISSHQKPSFSFFISVFFLFEENQLTLYHGRIKSRNPSVRIQASVSQCDRSATIYGINQKKLWVLGVIGKEVKIHNSQRTQVSLSNASTRSESAVREREKGTEHVFAHIKRPLITSCPPCLAWQMDLENDGYCKKKTRQCELLSHPLTMMSK